MLLCIARRDCCVSIAQSYYCILFWKLLFFWLCLNCPGGFFISRPATILSQNWKSAPRGTKKHVLVPKWAPVAPFSMKKPVLRASFHAPKRKRVFWWNRWADTHFPNPTSPSWAINLGLLEGQFAPPRGAKPYSKSPLLEGQNPNPSKFSDLCRNCCFFGCV